MKDDTVVTLRQPGEFADPLTEVLRNGARTLLAQAIEAEVADFFAANADLTTNDGRQRLVRHGHLPERTIQTGIGPVEVRQPRVRDRGAAGAGRIHFSPAILPPYARRTNSLDMLLPVLYLRGVSTGDFQEALAALLGREAPNLSPAVLTRLKLSWQDEFDRWQKRAFRATEKTPYARDKFNHLKWLRKVVISARVYPLNALCPTAPRGEHNNRDG
jgi:putative transposase